MRNVTALACLCLMMWATTASAQQTEYILDIPTSTEFTDAFPTGFQSGVRAVAGPFDMDGDGLIEVLATDYTGGGRVHVVENKGIDTWELVYSTPWLDSTATSAFNARYAWGTNANADLDGDGRGEILLPTGRRFSENSPYPDQGIFVFEYTGTDDDYGEAPASILPIQDRIYVQGSMLVEDIDLDGIQELLFPNNGSDNAFDKWYIFSVVGDIGSGFEAWVPELEQASRPDHGSGSPYGFLTPNLDGQGAKELLLHSWNNYNFTIGQVLGADTYSVPGGRSYQAESAANNSHGASYDAVAFAGGTVIDINQDGDDEVFFNNFAGGGAPDDHTLTLINYEPGEDVSQVTSDNLIIDLIPGESFIWGLTSGDLDNDGNNEVISVGWGYSGEDRANGVPSQFIKIAEFIGGPGDDPEDPNNYFVERINTGAPVDTVGFDFVVRDSAGVVTTYYDNNDVFAFRAAYLGDADGDGDNEIALGFQGVKDSVSVIDEVWNADSLRYERTIRETQVAPSRPFMRILSGANLAVSTFDDVILPSDYKLSPNYPNPFNPSTSFTFTLPLDKRVSVHIYDILGRRIRTLVHDELYTAGTHQVTWNGRSDTGTPAASGTYLYTLEYGNFRLSRTMLLVK